MSGYVVNINMKRQYVCILLTYNIGMKVFPLMMITRSLHQNNSISKMRDMIYLALSIKMRNLHSFTKYLIKQITVTTTKVSKLSKLFIIRLGKCILLRNIFQCNMKIFRSILLTLNMQGQ